MKKLITLFLLSFTLGFAKAQSTELLKCMSFENLQNSMKNDYGSKNNPILSGAFLNVNDRSKMIRLKNSYRWPDGQRIDFNRRNSEAGTSSGEILDRYTLVKSGSTDTIILFVNPYKVSDTYYVPKGLVAINSLLLKNELVPYLTLVEELEDSKDPMNLKEQAAKLLDYIGSSCGMALFTDSDLKSFMEDKEIELALKSFLFRAYIFNKFYAYGKDIGNEKTYALAKMKSNFEKYIALHPDVKIGNLKEFLH